MRFGRLSSLCIESVSAPFDQPEMGQAALEVLGLADAIGLLPPDTEFRVLDCAAVLAVAEHISKAGIATQLIWELRESLESPHAGDLLRQLAGVLRESPAPEHEWQRLQAVLANDQLAELLGISPTSVARYRARDRKTPDIVAARLHLLARIIHHLEGIYNEFGVRRWFQRPRTALNDKKPADILHGDWDPDSKDSMQVLEIARSGNRAAAT